MSDSNGHDYRAPLDYVRAERGSSAASAFVSDNLGKSGVAVLWLGILGFGFGLLGLAFGLIAMRDTAVIHSIAADAARAAAKAETATARANTAEIYAYQVYTELNRLGYPVRTPAEDHVPQPPTDQTSESQ